MHRLVGCIDLHTRDLLVFFINPATHESTLEDGDVVINLGAMFLCNTFWNPDDVTALLLLQFQVRIEHTEMKLLHECIDIQFNLKMNWQMNNVLSMIRGRTECLVE